MNQETFIRHCKNEKKHWWFKGRREILKSVIKKNIKEKKLNILDFGSGSGTNINILKEYGTVYVYEKNKIMRNLLKNKFQNNKNIKIIEKLNKLKYDIILAADVIEHIKKDILIIKKLNYYLKKKGKIFITVPAYQLLFSKKDLELKHFRRYNILSLKKLLINFKILKITYFNFFLFFPQSLLILFFKLLNINFIKNAEKTPNIFINKILYIIFTIEKYFINYINFPFGLSILCVCQKNEK